MDNASEEIPKGLDLETSFYNFSCALAVRMYIANKTTVTAIDNQFPFPQAYIELNPFEEFFFDDDKTKLARLGVQIIEVDSKARFTHKSIMEYYAARVFYEEIKFFDPTKHIDLHAYLEGIWLNTKILKGDSVTDQESEVLNFLIDMIAYNLIKQREMQEGDGDDEVQS